MTVKTKANGLAHTLLEDDDLYDILYPVGSVRLIATSYEVYSKDPIINKIGTTWVTGRLALKSCKDSKYAIDIEGGTMASGTNIRLYKYNGSTAQLWFTDFANTTGTSYGGIDFLIRTK